MLFSDVQARIRERLDNRTDLDPVIYNYALGRIAFWSSFFFYSSDITDTSIITKPGQYLYNLPGGMRFVQMVRLLLPGGPPASTTLTQNVVLPVSTLPVASTAGFTATTGALNVGNAQVTYGGVDATNFLTCVGGVGSFSVGAAVNQLNGIWVELTNVRYGGILSADLLSPQNRSIPAFWGQFNTMLRLYLTPAAQYGLELTGNAAPEPPVDDGSNNWWTGETDGAAWLIIASTANEIRKGYLHEEALTADVELEEKERRRIMKLTIDLIRPMQIRAHF